MAGYNTSLDAAPIVRDSVTHDRGRMAANDAFRAISNWETVSNIARILAEQRDHAGGQMGERG